MEQKNVIAWDTHKEGRDYRLVLPMDAPLGEAYEAAREFLAKIVELINSDVEVKEPEQPEVEAEEPESVEESVEE